MATSHHRSHPRDSLVLARPEASALASRRPSAATLYWKGARVSDEFERYALRIEQGEQLPLFRGEVLERRSLAFRWNLSGDRPRRVGADRWSVAQCMVLAGVVMATAFAALVPLRPRAPVPPMPSELPPLLTPIWESAARARSMGTLATCEPMERPAVAVETQPRSARAGAWSRQTAFEQPVGRLPPRANERFRSATPQLTRSELESSARPRTLPGSPPLARQNERRGAAVSPLFVDKAPF